MPSLARHVTILATSMNAPVNKWIMKSVVKKPKSVCNQKNISKYFKSVCNHFDLDGSSTELVTFRGWAHNLSISRTNFIVHILDRIKMPGMALYRSASSNYINHCCNCHGNVPDVHPQ
eukprot:4211189-Amphidinium_carterae.1